MEEYPRQREVLAFLRRQGWEKRPWVAIDDDPDNYRPGANVVLTDPARGFDPLAAESLMRVGR